MVMRQKELMFKCTFQGVPAPALPWAEGWRPEPAWLSQGAETPAPLPASPAGQIELLQTAVFSEIPTIWPSLHWWVCVCGQAGEGVSDSYVMLLPCLCHREGITLGEANQLGN